MTQVVSIQSLGPGDTPLTPQNPLTEMLVSHSPEKSSLCTAQSSLIILPRVDGANSIQKNR